MIDWKNIDQFPESTCYCRCGDVFRSHAKFDYTAGGLVSRKPCPACGRSDDCRKVSSDPEVWTVKR